MSKTPANLFFEKLHRELILRGIWDRSAKKLVVDLREHLTEETETQIANGSNAAEAQSLALQKLGAPAEVAEAAAQERINRAPWFMRSMLLMVVAGIGLGILSLALGWLMPIFLPYYQPSLYKMAWFKPLFILAQYNFWVFLLSFSTLAWLMTKLSLGWKYWMALIFSTAVVAGFTELAYVLSFNFLRPDLMPKDLPLTSLTFMFSTHILGAAALCAMPWILRHWKLRQLRFA